MSLLFLCTFSYFHFVNKRMVALDMGRVKVFEMDFGVRNL